MRAVQRFNAEKAVRTGGQVALLAAGVTAALAVAGVGGIGLWSLVDAVILVVLGVLVLGRNHWAAVALVGYWVLNLVSTLDRVGMGVVRLLVLIAFARAAVAAFRLAGEPEESDETDPGVTTARSRPKSEKKRRQARRPPSE